ncbi:MAG: ribonucleoside-diphosphate reductase, adenosylcobalamin-dependent, partial [Thiomonas sp. 20-64-5]
ADHAWRLYRSMGHDMTKLPSAFVTALEMSAADHMKMLQVVQPFIDTSISKTVNVPADYPYDDFKELYLQAWKAGLKGLATYRPNAVLGAVLQATPSAPVPAAASGDIDPLTRRIEGRPAGDLQAVTSKISYMTSEGQKTVYLSVSFAEVEGRVNGEAVRIERPIEFFMPAGQRDEGQQWIASNMRLLSLVARSGGSIAKSLQNMREVVWDKGPVRCGEVIKADGSRAPRFHQSEVAAIAYALQELLRRRGYLDASGREQSLLSLAQRAHVPEALRIDLESADASPDLLPGGRICPECGGPFLRRVDGCDRCENCGYIGSCG